MSESIPSVAIVDYGLGNLFSIRHACEYAQMRATITSSREDLFAAAAIILPGIGAFGDAMQALERMDLVGPLRDLAFSGKPFIGICLGMQLLMGRSYEFGEHAGLGILEGDVVRFEAEAGLNALKVPQVCWNEIHASVPWNKSLLQDIRDGECMYFVHSFYVRPNDSDVVLSTTRYGQTEFCSSLHLKNIFGCQFHPERSGRAGLRIYQNIAASLKAVNLQETL